MEALKQITRLITMIVVLLMLGMVLILTTTVSAQETVSQEVTAVATQESTAVLAQDPTAVSTEQPTVVSTQQPTVVSTQDPTAVSTQEPTAVSTQQPTAVATEEPTAVATLEPTSVSTVEPTVVPPTSSLVVGKVFCASLNEEAGEDENPCVGRVEAAEGSVVQFVMTRSETGEEFTFGVEIGAYEGVTVGAIQIVEVPLGTYQVCEVVPAGYQALAACMTVTVETAEGLLVFVNLPVGQAPPETTKPPAGEVIPPDVDQTVSLTGSTTAGTETEAPNTGTDTTVDALPSTGSGLPESNANWAIWLAIIVLILTAVQVHRMVIRQGRGLDPRR